MIERYVPEEFEAKWRARWKDSDLFRTREEAGRPKFYGLDFFPYPSGAGLSVGHCSNYIPTDVLCRLKYMQGHNVLHPMGFDAFGLPAENEAIKRKRHPAGMIDDYAGTYQRQMELIGISYDWSRSFKSSDPTYYKWTQWIFLKLYEKGLAYRKMAAVNWDPVDKTVLADEEVIGGRAERSGALVEKKLIPQWFFKITAYADRLVDDLDDLDWPEGIKNQQRNWIGRSTGVEFEMRIVFADSGDTETKEEKSARGRIAGSLPKLRSLAAEALAELEAGDNSGLVERARAVASGLDQMGLGGDDWIDQVRALSEEIDGLEDEAEEAGFEDAADKYDTISDRLEDVLGEDDDDFEVLKAEAVPSFRVFTTRVDTINGMTFCVLAPEHPMVEAIKKKVGRKRRKAIAAYQKQAKELSDLDRQAANREKSGEFTGAYAVNPANGRRVPIYIADYVLMGYGTGAIMAVPGHDQRDFDFALAFGLDVVPVIEPDDAYLASVCPSEVQTREGRLEWYTANIKSIPEVFTTKEAKLFNSGSHNGMSVADAQESLGVWFESEEKGERKTNYKLRDWLISRQRYWGCPIPIVYDKEGEEETCPEQALPVLLPDVDNYEPSDDGSSPLSRIPEYVNVTTREGALGRRETDTMGGFACSSWYFLRFCDPHNDGQAWSLKKAEMWMPVDCYVGGAEHAVMHLLYARFWTKVLHDLGLVAVKEPFARLMNQGQVLAQTPYRQPREGEKLGVGEEGILVSFAEAAGMPADDLTWKWARMSKSKGNVVTPDEAVEQYGADALRIYILFVAPFESTIFWSNEGMQGAVRFLDRVVRLAGQMQALSQPNWKNEIDAETPTETSKAMRRTVHGTIRKVTEDFEKFAFNTAISALMIMVNDLTDLMKKVDASSQAEVLAVSEALESLVLLIAPAAPHTADELWESLGRSGFTYQADWPSFRQELAKAEVVTIAVQVNGKLRDTIEVAAEAGEDEVKSAAQSSRKVLVFTEGKEVKKIIFVPGKLVNIVVAG